MWLVKTGEPELGHGKYLFCFFHCWSWNPAPNCPYKPEGFRAGEGLEVCGGELWCELQPVWGTAAGRNPAQRPQALHTAGT